MAYDAVALSWSGSHRAPLSRTRSYAAGPRLLNLATSATVGSALRTFYEMPLLASGRSTYWRTLGNIVVVFPFIAVYCECFRSWRSLIARPTWVSCLGAWGYCFC